MQTSDVEMKGNIRWGYAIGCILLSCIRVGKPELFFLHREEGDGVESLCKGIIDLIGKKDAEWWIQIVLTGSWSYSQPQDYLSHLIDRLGYSDGEPQRRERFLSGFSDAWSGDPNQLIRVSNLIEEARSL